MAFPQPINIRKPPAISPNAIIGVVILGFALITFWTSYYTVPAESEGVVQRFGKYQDTVQAGLHFKWPFGIDVVTILPTRRQLKMEFGFYSSNYTNPDQVGGDQEREKSMVTGDLNAALVEWVIQYRIQDPKQYLFDVRNPLFCPYRW